MRFQLRKRTPDASDTDFQSEEVFRRLVEGVEDYAIFVLDLQGFVSTWNAGAQRIKGYSAQEIIGEHFSRFYPEEALATGWPAQALRRALKEGRVADEGWRLRKDGSRFWADVVITTLRDKDGNAIGFTKITRDLTERRRIQELESEGQRMTEFIAMLAHELRNPLAPIANVAGILEKLDGGPELQWCAQVVTRQVNHLSRLVDDLLDVSRISRGKIQLRTESIELGVLLTHAVESVRPVVDRYGHALELALPDTALHVQGDATRLTQVVVNLVTNSAKYTPDGGHIRVQLQRDGARARIVVADNGIGMTGELLVRVFDLFVQGTRTLQRAEGGLGIGLTLVHQIVQLHGGDIAAHSDGPGAGSRMTVALPLEERFAG